MTDPRAAGWGSGDKFGFCLHADEEVCACFLLLLTLLLLFLLL